jgi:hypothetical protein
MKSFRLLKMTEKRDFSKLTKKLNMLQLSDCGKISSLKNPME